LQQAVPVASRERLLQPVRQIDWQRLGVFHLGQQ
jgi:hypothetical protein